RIAVQAQRVRKGATPSEVVYEEDHLKLLHYPGDGQVKHKTPLLFVFALVNRPYILDILPNKSVVAHFVKAGFDTYLIDWGAATDADRHLTLDDYVNGYLRNALRQIRQRTAAAKVSLLGYCMGGTMSAMFTALHPEYVKNLILLAAGIDFSAREGLLNLWSDAKNFDVDAFVDDVGNCPADFLQSCFTMLSPVRNLLGKPVSLMERMDDAKFVEEFLTMEAWINDNVAVPGEVFRDFVKHLYQQNLLVKKRMQVGRHVVDLERITCPVLNLLASQDTLVPAAQSEPFTGLVGSEDTKTIELATGHIGLAVGSAAQRELWPQAVAWLAERS
ncbi:MAG: class III poly(R)-hydroxyalkanoic acid synthase subunit PhaC, partial [Thermoguttaceae bacterium]